MSIFFAVFNIKIRRIDQKSSGHVQRTKKEDGEPI